MKATEQQIRNAQTLLRKAGLACPVAIEGLQVMDGKRIRALIRSLIYAARRASNS